MGFLTLPFLALLAGPGVFAPGVVSSAAHEGPFALTPDGRTIYFTRFAAGMAQPTFFLSKLRDGRWSEAQPAAMPEGITPHPFSFSPDGSRLFYTHEAVEKRKPAVWVAERDGDGWKNARPAGGALERWEADQVSPSVSADGTLYFSSNPGGEAQWDIYRSALIDGRYAEPELLGKPRHERISTTLPETEVAVSADGKLLVFSSSQSRNGQGGSDLYLVELPAHERWGAWTWTLAQVNTFENESFPQLSADGRRLMFCRGGDIYEIALETLRRPPAEAPEWKRRAELPSVRQWPQAAVVNGKVYVYGGIGRKGWSNDMDVYDPETDAWTAAGPGPEGWKEGILVCWKDRLFLIRRGGPGVAEYRFESKRWEMRAAQGEFAVPEASPWATRTVAIGRKAYTTFSSEGFSYFVEYDLETGGWTPRRAMPSPCPQLAAWGGRVYAFGERTMVYDPAADRWSDAGGAGIPRFETAPVALGGEIWLIGGHGVRVPGVLGDVTPEIARFDPKTGRWSEGPPLPWLRWGSAAVVVKGRLFVMAGIKPGPVWSGDRSVFEYTGGR